LAALAVAAGAAPLIEGWPCWRAAAAAAAAAATAAAAAGRPPPPYYREWCEYALCCRFASLALAAVRGAITEANDLDECGGFSYLPVRGSLLLVPPPPAVHSPTMQCSVGASGGALLRARSTGAGRRGRGRGRAPGPGLAKRLDPSSMWL
jgi:hypothetical protein